MFMFNIKLFKTLRFVLLTDLCKLVTWLQVLFCTNANKFGHFIALLYSALTIHSNIELMGSGFVNSTFF